MYQNVDSIDIYKMKLHDTFRVLDGPLSYSIIRVAGGWIYNFDNEVVFIPFHNEFQK